LAEGACNIAGLGYKKSADQKEGGKWNGITNVDAYGVETAQNMKCVLDLWNQQTQKWLIYVVYERTKGSVYATMGLSMIWHGPYLGYVMTFATAAVVTEAARKVRRTVRPFFLPEKNESGGTPPMKKLYDVLTWLTTLSVLNYMVGPFVMLEASMSYEYFKSFYFIPHMFIVATVVFLPGKPKKPKTEEKKKE
jgi:hypothetical protein